MLAPSTHRMREPCLMPLNIPVMVLTQGALARRERDIHLIEAEEILLAGGISGYFLVAIEYVAQKGETLGFRQMLGPRNEGHRAKSQKGGARSKIPGLGFAMGAASLKTVALGQIYVLFDRQVEIRILKGLEVAVPVRGEA